MESFTGSGKCSCRGPGCPEASESAAAMQVEANPPSTLHDIMWRNRVRMERKAADQPPPRPDPRSLAMTELLGLNPDAVQVLRQPPSIAGLRMNMSSVEGGLFHAMHQPHDRPRGGGAFAPAIKRDQSIHYPRRQSDRRPVMSRVTSAPALRPSTAPPQRPIFLPGRRAAAAGAAHPRERPGLGRHPQGQRLLGLLYGELLGARHWRRHRGRRAGFCVWCGV